MAEPQPKKQKTSPAAQDLSGTTVGRFAIRARLGGGGMGEVYLADDLRLKRRVALKRLSPKLRDDAQYHERLLREAEFSSRLSCENIAAIYDVFESEGEFFLVMEYVEGQSLRQHIAQRFAQAPGIPFPAQTFLDIACQCASALAAAHEKGVVHRDIKPENIMLTPKNQVKILDFGVARPVFRGTETLTSDDPLSESGTSGGTIAYMAPEVLLEKETDARSDIFSLGLVFYEALTGKHPFMASTALATSNRILHQDASPVSRVNAEIRPELERIVAKMLQKDPANRQAGAADLLAELRSIPGSEATTTAHVVPAVRRPNWTAAGIAAGAVAVALALLAAIPAVRQSAARLLGLSAPAVESGWILVADFDNKSGEPLFDETASELLRHSLEQSRYVQVVPRAQEFEAASRTGRRNFTHIDAGLGREICQRENYRAMLSGGISASGSTFLLHAELIDPVNGSIVYSDSASFRAPGDLYPAVDTLARRLRAHLGESLAQIARNGEPLARVTTPSLAALQRYSRAIEFFSAGDMEAFMPLAQSAVALDPNFAMAHLSLAAGYERLGDVKPAREALGRARQGVDHVTERERYLILAEDFSGRGLYEKAAEQCRLLTEIYPNDLEGYRGLAEASVWAGRPEDAIPAARRAVELDPNSGIDRQRLILYLDRVNQFSDALAAYRDAQARGVKNPLLHWGSGLAYLGLGDAASAQNEFELLRQEGGAYEENLATFFQARVLLYQGRLAKASETLRAGLVLDEKMRSGAWVPVRRYLLAGVEKIEGRTEELVAESRRLAEIARASDFPQDLHRAGIVAVAARDPATAKKLLSQLDQARTQESSAFNQGCYYNLLGEIELAEGKVEEAISSERRSALFFASFEPQQTLGRALASRKEWSAAAQALESYLQFKGTIFSDGSPADWVLAHLLLARALSRAGDDAKALSSYDGFLRLWGEADPGLAVVRQAQQERELLRAKLASSSSKSQ
jgi:tetratricopeptide (TPR) repeat protein/tRNA A-37 threonylcarbamoyl transferase component Bud32